jgi:formamidopyrimidine-DNA glycosylase
MPELPEVTTIVNELKEEIIGKTIENIEVRLSKIVQGNIGKIIGQTVKSVERRAKLIIIRLREDNLAIHLKLTGQLFFLPPGRKQTMAGEGDDKYTHVIFYFTDGSKILFKDVRRFGYIKVLSTQQLTNLLTEEYGVEPLDSIFTVAKLMEIIRAHSATRAKPLLTDQAIMAGIGNIYVDESLWEAKIHPKTKVGNLTDREIDGLHRAIKKILTEALKYHGTSIDSYRRTTGEKGEYEFHRRVYQRDGEACLRCGTTVKRIVVGGRGTHFCPRCQVQKH